MTLIDRIIATDSYVAVASAKLPDDLALQEFSDLIDALVIVIGAGRR